MRYIYNTLLPTTTKLYTTIPQNITEEVLINEALWELQTREVQTIMPNSNK